VDHRAHVNVTDFYWALELLTDGAGLQQLPVSRLHVESSNGTDFDQDNVDVLRVIVRQWQVAKMHRRAGIFLLPRGVSGTKPGKLALLCRACPDPVRNLPSNWSSETSLSYSGCLAHPLLF
jgi:hypothetical protein